MESVAFANCVFANSIVSPLIGGSMECGGTQLLFVLYAAVDTNLIHWGVWSTHCGGGIGGVKKYPLWKNGSKLTESGYNGCRAAAVEDKDPKQ